MCLVNVKKVDGRNNKEFPKRGTYYKVVDWCRRPEFFRGDYYYDKGTYVSKEGPGFHCFMSKEDAWEWMEYNQETIRVRVLREDIVGTGYQDNFTGFSPCILAKKIRVID